MATDEQGMRRCAEFYAQECDTKQAEVDRLTAQLQAKEAEVGRLRGRLLNIVQCYEIRSELYTSDEQCAENLHDKARQALEQSHIEEDGSGSE